MLIDAHHHLWTADYPWLQEPGLAPLRRDYTVDDLLPALASAGIDGSVLVESGRCDVDETRHFLALAAATPKILGVVGWASFTDPDLGSTISALREQPGGDRLVGIRDQLQCVPELGHLARPDVRAAFAAIGAAGLACDLVVRRDQLPGCVAAVAATPQTTFVLDHLGKPRITPTGLAAWRARAAPLAALPNCAAQLRCQAVRPAHRGRPILDAGRHLPLRRDGARAVRRRPPAVRLGLAGLHTGCVVLRHAVHFQHTFRC